MNLAELVDRIHRNLRFVVEQSKKCWLSLFVLQIALCWHGGWGR